MYCSKCGNQLEDKAIFCEKCGNPARSQEWAQLQVKWKKEKTIAAGAAFAVGLVLAVVWILLAAVNGKSISTVAKTEEKISKTSEHMETEEKDSKDVTPKQDKKAEDYILEESSSRYMRLDELENLDKEQLAYARNEIFAKHGYIFTEQEYKAYFNSKAWYQERVPAEEFDEFNMLNDYEKVNLNNILFFENKSTEFADIAGTYSMYVDQLGVYMYIFIYPDGLIVNYYAVDNTGYLYSEYLERKDDGIVIKAYFEEYGDNDYITVDADGLSLGDGEYYYSKESDQIVKTGEYGIYNNTMKLYADGSLIMGDTDGGNWTGEDWYDNNLGLSTAEPVHHTRCFTYNDCLFECTIYDIEGEYDMRVGAYEYRGDEMNGMGSENEKEQFVTKLKVPSYYLSTAQRRNAF